MERDLPDWRIQNRLVAGPAVRVFAGTIDDAVVGFAVVAVHGSGLSLAGTIEGIYVEPEARELGVGEALLDAVIAWCRSLGCRALDGTALPGDRATKNFLRPSGWLPGPSPRHGRWWTVTMVRTSGPDQRPCHFGARFSMKAVRPSFTSSERSTRPKA